MLKIALGYLVVYTRTPVGSTQKIKPINWMVKFNFFLIDQYLIAETVRFDEINKLIIFWEIHTTKKKHQKTNRKVRQKSVCVLSENTLCVQTYCACNNIFLRHHFPSIINIYYSHTRGRRSFFFSQCVCILCE